MRMAWDLFASWRGAKGTKLAGVTRLELAASGVTGRHKMWNRLKLPTTPKTVRYNPESYRAIKG
jgi:hypothetical protein